MCNMRLRRSAKKQPRLGAYTTMPAAVLQKFTLELARLQVPNLPHHDTVGSPNACGNRMASGPRPQPYCYPTRMVESRLRQRLISKLGHGTTASSRVFIGYMLDSNIVYQPPALTTPWAGDESATAVKNVAYHWLECR